MLLLLLRRLSLWIRVEFLLLFARTRLLVDPVADLMGERDLQLDVFESVDPDDEDDTVCFRLVVFVDVTELFFSILLLLFLLLLMLLLIMLLEWLLSVLLLSLLLLLLE